MGPCMCGDLYCGSCGPAQGNHKCPACGRWSMDGECDNPQKCAEACRQMDEAMAAEFQWEQDHQKEIDAIFDNRDSVRE